jgi:hypothetical protein
MVMDRSIFHKAYKETYFQEIFEIFSHKYSNPPRYKLRDLLKQVIKGTFYEQQLTKVQYDYTRDLERLEKVVRYRKGVTGKEALVRWKGYSPQYDTWLRVEDIANYV